MKKILIYGGGFNPPHLGHEHVLKSAIKHIEPDLTLVIPSAISPHKAAARVSLGIRAQMCRTFKSCGENIKISEIEHAGKHDKSYTVKTLRHLLKIYKNAALYFLIGSDMLLSFEHWRRYRRILSMTTLVAASRDDDDLNALEKQKNTLCKKGGKVIILRINPLSMSSTEIRIMLKNGDNTDDFLSASTQNVIKKYGVYQ